MLPNSAFFVGWGVAAILLILLIFILVKVNRVSRYFYTPELRNGSGNKYPPISKDWKPARAMPPMPPMPKSHKPHYRGRNYGRHG